MEAEPKDNSHDPLGLSGALYFGNVTIDVASRLLWRDGQVRDLPENYWKGLTLLIARRPQTVSREELCTATGATISTLYKQIDLIRDGLDPKDRKRFIRSERKEGYRFVAVPERQAGIATPSGQHVRWAPVDGKAAGICIESCQDGQFIPWVELRPEVEKMLLPQVRRVPIGSTVSLRDLGDRRNWVVRIVNPAGKDIGDLWFGTDADGKWNWDGLIRLGDSYRDSPEQKVVWQIFQRYPDGSYRRLEAIMTT
jgi:DNA-binding winged helix-turn-helix (wHTH) protein